MSEQIDDGGSVTADIISERYVAGLGMLEEKVKSVGGLSIRDYFAAAALEGLVSAIITAASGAGLDPEQTGKELSEACYALADKMLAARKGGTPS
jgi:hypothetical protein